MESVVNMVTELYGTLCRIHAACGGYIIDIRDLGTQDWKLNYCMAHVRYWRNACAVQLRLPNAKEQL